MLGEVLLQRDTVLLGLLQFFLAADGFLLAMSDNLLLRSCSSLFSLLLLKLAIAAGSHSVVVGILFLWPSCQAQVSAPRPFGLPTHFAVLNRPFSPIVEKGLHHLLIVRMANVLTAFFPESLLPFIQSRNFSPRKRESFLVFFFFFFFFRIGL